MKTTYAVIKTIYGENEMIYVTTDKQKANDFANCTFSQYMNGKRNIGNNWYQEFDENDLFYAYAECEGFPNYDIQVVKYENQEEQNENEKEVDNMNNENMIEVLRAIMNGDLGTAREILNNEIENKHKFTREELQEKIDDGTITEQEIFDWNENNDTHILTCEVCGKIAFEDMKMFSTCDMCNKTICMECDYMEHEIDYCPDCHKEILFRFKVSELLDKFEENGIQDLDDMAEYVLNKNIDLQLN